MILKTLWTTICLLLVAPFAHALEYPVSYVVDLKEIKSVIDGAPLTFELHATRACNAAFQSQVINAGDASLVLESIKTRKVKAGPKVPKEVHLRTNLELTAPAQDLYFLKVTGDGVSAIGSDCQPQVPPRLRHVTKVKGANASNSNFLTSPPCLSDEVATGGGCGCTGSAVQRSEPTADSWYCQCRDVVGLLRADVTCLGETYAVCGNGTVEDWEQCEQASDCPSEIYECNWCVCSVVE